MLYYLTIALQGFCIYHLIKNKNEYYWIFLIIFIPVIGSAIYLVSQVYNKRDTNIIKENLTSVLIPTKKVKDLEKRLQFSETFQNRLDLRYFIDHDLDDIIPDHSTICKTRKRIPR